MMSFLPKLNPCSMNLKKNYCCNTLWLHIINSNGKASREERKQRSLWPVFTSTLSSSFLKSEQAGELLLGMRCFPQVWGQWGSWYSGPSLPGKRIGLWLLRHQPNSSRQFLSGFLGSSITRNLGWVCSCVIIFCWCLPSWWTWAPEHCQRPTEALRSNSIVTEHTWPCARPAHTPALLSNPQPSASRFRSQHQDVDCLVWE